MVEITKSSSYKWKVQHALTQFSALIGFAATALLSLEWPVAVFANFR